MEKNTYHVKIVLSVLATLFFLAAPQSRYAATPLANYCTESADSLTPLGEQSLPLGNDWELTADRMGWCRKKDDSAVDNIVVARGYVQIGKKGEKPILSVDFSDMRFNELGDVAVTVERDDKNTVSAVSPSYSGLGMRLSASNIIKYAGSEKTSEITLINDFPWRFYPNEDASNLILYPAFFRPVLTGISDGTFGWTGSLVDALEQEFKEGSLNLSIPFTVSHNAVSSVDGHEPVLMFNIGTWFGKVFGFPLESVPVVLSQEAGQSHAQAQFSVSKVLEGIPGDLLKLLSHGKSIAKVFDKYGSKDQLKLTTKKAIVWGDAKLVKYSKGKLSYLFDEHKAKFLKEIEEAKENKSTNMQDLFKALGRFVAMVDNSEIDYDFINQDIALNPLYVQIGLFEEVGDFKGDIYARFSKRGDPAWYFIDTLGLDVTMPYEVTQLSAFPFFGLEKIPLAENPFQVGLGVIELGGTISGMADPLYDVFQLAGKGGDAVDYSKWHVDAETEGKVTLVDSMTMIMDTQEVALPWPLTLKTTLDFKLGNQNGIAGTGTVSLFDAIEGKGSSHFFIGNNAKPIDFQAGLSASVIGVDIDGTLSSYLDRNKTFWMKMHDEVSFSIAGHKLGGLPFEMDFSFNETEVALSAGFSWESHFCACGHCLVHAGNKSKSWKHNFSEKSAMGTELETTYGDSIYASNEPVAEHLVNVESGNERLTITAQCSPGAYPEFTVSGPEDAYYFMEQNENDGGSIVLDLHFPKVCSSSASDSLTMHEHGFLVDSVTGTTSFVLEDPQPGQYTVSLSTAPEFCSQVTADVTARMVTLSPPDIPQQTIVIDEANNESFTVALGTEDTFAGSRVGIYARPTTFRNSTYDYWHEKLFRPSAKPSDRDHLSDEGNFVYMTDENFGSTVGTLGYLEASAHDLEDVVEPLTNIEYINPPLTFEETTSRQQNRVSIKLGEFLLNGDGQHELILYVGAHEVYHGKYRLIAKYENRKDSAYVELPYVLTVQNGALLLPAPAITSVAETENGEASIRWSSRVDSAEFTGMRVFLHDHAKGSSEEVYHTHFDFNAAEPIKVEGLRKGESYSFSMALLKEVTRTDDNGRTHTLSLPGLRSDTVAFTPQGEAFVGSPSVKLVDYESFANFEDDGDLFVRLRILNESKTAMKNAPLRIYYNHRTDENLLAEFHATQAGLSYSDMHATIPFKHICALEESDGTEPTIVYDIETDSQDEHLMYDNSGIIKIENADDFLALKDSVQGTSILLNLKRGWNLVGDAIEEEDIYQKLTQGTVYSHNGTRMQAGVPNTTPGGGYFVYLTRDTNIALTGTPVIPDFENLDENKWQLMGTGVDVYNTLANYDDSNSEIHTYTPGQGCESIYAMQRNAEGETQWEQNPDIIKAGGGFWCVKEQ